MMDDILTITSLEPKKVVTKLNYEALRAHTETGHHNVSGWDVRKSQESCTVHVPAPQVDKREEEKTRKREKETERQRDKKTKPQRD